MNYILTVEYFPINSSGCVVCRRRIFVRFYTRFDDLKRKLRYLNRTTRIIDYHVEEMLQPAKPAKV